MDPDRLKEYIRLMEENDLSELEVEEDGKRIRLKKNINQPETVSNSAPVAQAPLSAAPRDVQKNYIEIKAPMVGTFYRTPSPGAKPYKNIGDMVKPGEVVCIIEAMKLMNEIKSEVTGKIVKIPVDNSEPIEFGQVLFCLEPTE